MSVKSFKQVIWSKPSQSDSFLITCYINYFMLGYVVVIIPKIQWFTVTKVYFFAHVVYLLCTYVRGFRLEIQFLSKI